jgi:hypothetical protein
MRRPPTDDRTQVKIDHTITHINYSTIAYDKQGRRIEHPDQEVKSALARASIEKGAMHLSSLGMLMSIADASKLRNEEEARNMLENIGELINLLTEDMFSSLDRMKGGEG